jgi:OPA family glycerol-3-phosphate transporter-like MFS transporter
MSKESFGIIFGAGTITYGLSFLLNGPLVDKLGGKKGIIIASVGACLANILMGLATYLLVKGRAVFNVTVAFATLYSLNMFFQSYGAVSIIKVKAYWFHVRERGVFGAIFGTLISFGVYFAFDWGQAIVEASRVKLENPSGFQKIFRALFAPDLGTHDAIWLVFFIPAFILIFWTLMDVMFIKDSPGQAGFEDFDTHDASSGEMHLNFSIPQLLKKVFKSRVIMLISFVEFTTGVVRNGVMQWYFIFGKEVKQPGAEFFHDNWGLLLCVTGIIGGFVAGFVSDQFFGSRRGPPVVLGGGVMVVFALVMSNVLFTSPIMVGVCAVVLCLVSISIHSLMSGTAAADFGGRKATATASGVADGFVYLGTGLQSLVLGFLTTKDWHYWPLFLFPFIVLGIILAFKMWKDIPAAAAASLKRR